MQSYSRKAPVHSPNAKAAAKPESSTLSVRKSASEGSSTSRTPFPEFTRALYRLTWACVAWRYTSAGDTRSSLVPVFQHKPRLHTDSCGHMT